MPKRHKRTTFGTKSSTPIESCQTCNNTKLKNIIFLGYLPPVNTMPMIGSIPHEQPSYPAQLLYCNKCHLVQIGLIVDPQIIFPKEYPYTSGTTKILRDNFADLYNESKRLLKLKKDELIVDIGSNDGTLLENFTPTQRVVGVTPEDIGTLAIEKGIPTLLEYFTDQSVQKLLKKYGKARIVTAANVFAHIEDVHSVIKNFKNILSPNGVFISESHYLLPLIKTVQYDTIYHEHLRYYSLHSLSYLLAMHGFEVFHVKKIPSHGGSFRVYAAKKGQYPVSKTVKKLLTEEKNVVTNEKAFRQFSENVLLSKLKLHSLLYKIKKQGKRIYGISAPSRASTLINYVGIDDKILDYVLEVIGSKKIGKYIPGTIIPVVEEKRLFEDQPEYALLLSWHIAQELIPKLREKGYKGKFIIPLPSPRIVS